MVMNLEETCLKGERIDSEKKNKLNFGDFKFDEDSPDIADLLPRDPFGMDFNINLPFDSTIDVNFSLPKDPFGMDFIGFITEELIDDSQFVAEINFVWAAAEEERNNVVANEAISGNELVSGEMTDLMLFGCEKYQDCNCDEEVPPLDALEYALGYLGIRDLLVVECVCKSLHDTVRKDPFRWKNIVIDYPLCDFITDNDLLQLTNRAQGMLQSLSLVKCMKITTSGLKRVLEANAQLTKLSVAGCMRLSAGSVYDHIKTFNSIALQGIKQLRIGNLLGLTDHLFEDFKILLGCNREKKWERSKPRFYRDGELYLSLDDKRGIDVEICSRCLRPGQVYDCPAETCRAKINSNNPCRGCICCIARCICCGCCLEDKEFEETFLLESLCFDCLSQLINSATSFYYRRSRLTFTRMLG